VIAKTISQGYDTKEFLQQIREFVNSCLKKEKEIMSNQYEGVVYGLLPGEEKNRLLAVTKLQYYSGGLHGWLDWKHPHEFSDYQAYRQKPERKWVPWTFKDIKENTRVYFKHPLDRHWRLIISAGSRSVFIADAERSVTYDDLLENYLQYPSGDPCGKEVDGDE